MYHLITILQDLEHDSYKRIELVMHSSKNASRQSKYDKEMNERIVELMEQFKHESFESTFRELCYTVLKSFDSWSAVTQDIYDEEINSNHLDSEENIDPQNSQQSFNYSAIDCVAMGLDAEMDQEAATDQRILNVITNWNTNPTCQSSQDSGLASSYPQP
jgi:hypothetical protein